MVLVSEVSQNEHFLRILLDASFLEDQFYFEVLYSMRHDVVSYYRGLLQIMDQLVKGHIIFDHDGTLVSVSERGFSVFLGLKDLLAFLVNQNYCLYVWTARGREGTLASLKDNNILEYFTAISCAEDGVKPNISGLLQMLEGVDKKSILHIGDSKGDLIGAQFFGIDCVLAAWNNDILGKELKGEIPYIANTIDDLKKIIELKFS